MGTFSSTVRQKFANGTKITHRMYKIKIQVD